MNQLHVKFPGALAHVDPCPSFCFCLPIRFLSTRRRRAETLNRTVDDLGSACRGFCENITKLPRAGKAKSGTRGLTVTWVKCSHKR